jgi:hypothetical protein
MAYIVNKTDGSQLVTITDGTIDNSTSLYLFGKSYSGYGEYLNEDLVRLLENSASTASPPAPLRGELWFDTNTNQLKVYDGTLFKPTGGAKSQSAEPTGASAGDLWIDSDDEQLYFRDSSSTWQLVGPVYSKGQTLSGWKIETINDSFGTARVISSMYNGNTRVAILSSVTFIPASAPSGFPEIYAGITMSNVLGATFAGTTTTAANLNISGTTNLSGTVIAGGNIMRKDTAQTMAGVLTISTDSGMRIGAANDLQLTVSGLDSIISNVTIDGDIDIQVNNGGSMIIPIKIDAANARVGIFTSSPSVPFEVTGDVKITGNLSVSGEYDTTSTTNVLMNDVFVKLNNGNNSNIDSGVVVDRDSSRQAKLFWNASAGYWVAGKSESGTYSQIIRDEDAVTDGDANKGKVLKTTGAGNLKTTSLTLGSVGNNLVDSSTSVTESPNFSSADVTTKAQVTESITRWGGNAITVDGTLGSPLGNTIAGRRFVETSTPTSGQGSNGDLWFVREP